MRPELPDYGVFLQWPSEDDLWIHPEDRETASHLIPSDRVFKRTEFDGEYYHLQYGQIALRVKAALWLLVLGEGFDIGDRVEILSHHDVSTLGVATITEMRFAQEQQRITYKIFQREYALPETFLAEDLRSLEHKEVLGETKTVHPPQRLDDQSIKIDYLNFE